MDITAKGIPPNVYTVIKREAERKKRSLNAEIISALEAEATEAEKRRRMLSMEKDLERFTASLPLLPASAPLILEDRER